jgi:DNA polymerase-3 subunit gamma/tau
VAYQSLYRRFRPQRFGELVGQDHVAVTLRNAVREGRVAHAYLFSGQRGTGKTSTARILAKALNCAHLDDGEPCCACESCVAIAEGRSPDVFELDAASNRGIDDVRELISRVGYASPGRTKVYVLDEVHMLTDAASNALLKTLEEPPAHVVFVLATTDPQKVLPTIRSRTQPFEFRLVPPALLRPHLERVAADAGLDVGPDVIDAAVRAAGGSVRDALSALDQLAAAGSVPAAGAAAPAELVEALCERDSGRALVAVATACGAGADPRQLARDLVGLLREAFLVRFAPDVAGLGADDARRAADWAARLGPAGITRAIEALGEALVAMRDAADPRVTLEATLVRLTRPEVDRSLDAVIERLERLERRLGAQSSGGPGPAPVPAGSGPGPKTGRTGPQPPPPPDPRARPRGDDRPTTASDRPQPPPPSPVAAARARLAGAPPAGEATAPPSADPPPASPAGATDPGAPAAPLPTREEITMAWGDVILRQVEGRPRLAGGRWLAVEDGVAVFALPNAAHLKRCEELRPRVEAALAHHFGRPVPVRMVVDPGGPARNSEDVPSPEEVADIDLTELADAPSALPSGIDRILQAFPGATVEEQ